MQLDSAVPGGSLETKWDRHRFELKLINPTNKRKFEVIVVGTGLAGASASATTAGWIVGSGADIGTILDADEDGYLLVSLFAVDGTTAAAATSGQVTILIEYIDPQSDSSGRYTAGGTKG